MNRQDIIQLIHKCSVEVIPELESHIFQPEERLDDLGANSIDRAEIIMAVLESLSLKIPRIEAFGPRTIGELAQLLHEKTSGK